MNRSKTGKLRSRVAGLALLLAGGGLVPALLPSCETTLTTFNPCGTIFAFCQPEDVDLLFATVPDYGLDPSCTIPYYGIYGTDDSGDCAENPVFNNTPGPRPQ